MKIDFNLSPRDKGKTKQKPILVSNIEIVLNVKYISAYHRELTVEAVLLFSLSSSPKSYRYKIK